MKHVNGMDISVSSSDYLWISSQVVFTSKVRLREKAWILLPIPS